MMNQPSAEGSTSGYAPVVRRYQERVMLLPPGVRVCDCVRAGLCG